MADEPSKESPEVALKRRELDIRERELQLKEAEHNAPFWRNPVAVGLVVAGIALSGNLIATSIQSWNAQRVEKQKAQGNLILEAIKTGDKGQVTKNLTFFLQLGFLDDPDGRIQTFIANYAAVPVLPGESAREQDSSGPVDVGYVVGRIVGIGSDSKGIQGAVIKCRSGAGREIEVPATTDSNGSFRLLLPRGRYVLTFHIAGYRRDPFHISVVGMGETIHIKPDPIVLRAST